MNISFSSVERQTKILEFLQRNPRISIAELCENFSISQATARRDLEVLASEGKIQRVHGGAIAQTQAPPEQPILQRQSEQADEKIRIGQAAAATVQDGETIFLGSGTTVLELGRALRGRRNITVITNSLPIVNALAGSEGITLICLGGLLRQSEFSFIGHMAEQSLAEVRADKVFIGTRAISLEHGLTHEYLPETMTDRSILNAGNEIIVLADHSKVGRAATMLLAPLNRIHTFITDERTPPEFVKALERVGIKIVVT